MMHLVEQIPLEQFYYGKYITFNRLTTLLKSELRLQPTLPLEGENINIFVDLYQFLTPPLPYQAIRIKDPLAICSVVINYAIHLRKYFMDNWYTNPQIYLILSNGQYTSTEMYIPNYNSYYINRYNKAGGGFTDILQTNLKMIGVLSKYIPDVYFKIGSADTSVMIKEIIDKKPVTNIVISASHFMYQLPTVVPNTIVLRQKRNYRDDISFSYNAYNAASMFIYDSKNTILPYIKNNKLITMLLIMIGSSKLGVRSINTLPVALDILKTIDPGCEHDGNALYSYYRRYYMEHKTKKIHITEDGFLKRFLGLDILYQYKIYQHSSEYGMTNYIENLHDPETLKRINEKYFKQNPLNLEDI